MELMIFFMLLIIIVLMTYLFVEQSVLRRVMWIDPIEHWQEYYDLIADLKKVEEMVDREFKASVEQPSWLDKLFGSFR